LTTVLLGFARSYFVAGIFFAPLPSLLVHLHAAAMSCWILLFIAQAALIATGRVGLHRKLGVAGAVLAAFIAISGIAVVSACVRRGGVPPVFTKNFSLVNNVLGFLLFGILVGRAILVRRNSPAHKRLMLIATINLMIPAVARWPFLAPQQILPAIRLSLIIPLLLIVFFRSRANAQDSDRNPRRHSAR
jgi:hypothetical protein